MSTLGSLLALLGQNDVIPYNQQEALAIRNQAGDTSNRTSLLALQEAQQQRAAQERMLQYFQQNPQAALGGGPGQPPQSALGGLAAGPQAPMTQQAVTGGSPPGAAEVVPGGQDLSRFASAPPQSALGGLAAPQPNPLEALMRQDPRAAFMVQKQQQAQQEQALKSQAAVLGARVKVEEGLGRDAQGVHSQEDLDSMRQRWAQIDPQMAAELPRVYTKDAMEPVMARALDRKETLQQRIEASKVAALIRGQDVELAKAQQTGGKVNYEKDAQGNVVAVPEYATGSGPVQARPVLGADGQPIKSLEGQKLTAEQQRHFQTVEGGLRTHVDTLLAPLYAARDAIGRVEQSADQPSATGDLALITAFMQMIDPRTGVKDAEFRNAATSGSLLDRIQGYISKAKDGTPLDEDVRADFLQRARKLYGQYEKDYGGVKQQYRDLTSRMGGNPDNVVLDTGSTVAKTPGASGPKVVTRAAFEAERQRRNAQPGAAQVSLDEALAKAKAAGYEVR